MVVDIALSLLAVYLFGYKVSFEDPIAKTKSAFLNAQLIAIGISILSTAIATVLTKSKESLIKTLRIIAIISFLMIVVLLGVDININSSYNEQVFSEFYEKYEAPNENKAKKGFEKSKCWSKRCENIKFTRGLYIKKHECSN